MLADFLPQELYLIDESRAVHETCIKPHVSKFNPSFSLNAFHLAMFNVFVDPRPNPRWPKRPMFSCVRLGWKADRVYRADGVNNQKL